MNLILAGDNLDGVVAASIAYQGLQVIDPQAETRVGFVSALRDVDAASLWPLTGNVYERVVVAGLPPLWSPEARMVVTQIAAKAQASAHLSMHPQDEHHHRHDLARGFTLMLNDSQNIATVAALALQAFQPQLGDRAQEFLPLIEAAWEAAQPVPVAPDNSPQRALYRALEVMGSHILCDTLNNRAYPYLYEVGAGHGLSLYAASWELALSTSTHLGEDDPDVVVACCRGHAREVAHRLLEALPGCQVVAVLDVSTLGTYEGRRDALVYVRERGSCLLPAAELACWCGQPTHMQTPQASWVVYKPGNQLYLTRTLHEQLRKAFDQIPRETRQNEAPARELAHAEA